MRYTTNCGVLSIYGFFPNVYIRLPRTKKGRAAAIRKVNDLGLAESACPPTIQSKFIFIDESEVSGFSGVINPAVFNDYDEMPFDLFMSMEVMEEVGCEDMQCLCNRCVNEFCKESGGSCGDCSPKHRFRYAYGDCPDYIPESHKTIVDFLEM